MAETAAASLPKQGVGPPEYIPDSKVHGANMEPIWVLSAPDGPHVDPMNLAIRDVILGITEITGITLLVCCPGMEPKK